MPDPPSGGTTAADRLPERSIERIETNLAALGRTERTKPTPYADQAIIRQVRTLCREGARLKPGWLWLRPALCLGLDPSELSALCSEDAVPAVWISSLGKGDPTAKDSHYLAASLIDHPYGSMFADEVGTGTAAAKPVRMLLDPSLAGRPETRELAATKVRATVHRATARSTAVEMELRALSRVFMAEGLPSTHPIVLLLTGHEVSGKYLFDHELRATQDPYDNIAGPAIYRPLAERCNIGEEIRKCKYAFVQISAHADHLGIHLCRPGFQSPSAPVPPQLLAETISEACRSADVPRKPDYLLLNWCDSATILTQVLGSVSGVLAWVGPVETVVVLAAIRVFHRSVALQTNSDVTRIDDAVFKTAATEAAREAETQGRHLTFRLRDT